MNRSSCGVVDFKFNPDFFLVFMIKLTISFEIIDNIMQVQGSNTASLSSILYFPSSYTTPEIDDKDNQQYVLNKIMFFDMLIPF